MSEVISTVQYRNLSTIIGFDGYRVGGDGSVWSCRKRVWVKGKRGCHTIISDEWVQMKASPLNEYLRVSLSDNGNVKRIMVHQLVLFAFVGPQPEGMEACHENGNGRDNRLTNLRWDTPKANAEDMKRHGTRFHTVGEKNGEAVLADEEVLKIRADYTRGGVSQRNLAEQYGVAQRTIWAVVNHESWKRI